MLYVWKDTKYKPTRHSTFSKYTPEAPDIKSRDLTTIV